MLSLPSTSYYQRLLSYGHRQTALAGGVPDDQHNGLRASWCDRLGDPHVYLEHSGDQAGGATGIEDFSTSSQIATCRFH
jgi:hypothetical protein